MNTNLLSHLQHSKIGTNPTRRKEKRREVNRNPLILETTRELCLK